MIPEDETPKPEEPARNVEFHHRTLSDVQMRRWVSWITVIGTGIMSAFFFGFLIFQAIWGQAAPNTWLSILLDKHYAAMVGTPLSAVTAFCIVTLLEVTNGPIEFEALGFKFKGASGPIILWVFSFLAIGIVFHFLWGNPA
jgi:hypothetical protein